MWDCEVWAKGLYVEDPKEVPESVWEAMRQRNGVKIEDYDNLRREYTASTYYNGDTDLIKHDESWIYRGFGAAPTFFRCVSRYTDGPNGDHLTKERRKLADLARKKNNEANSILELADCPTEFVEVFTPERLARVLGR